MNTLPKWLKFVILNEFSLEELSELRYVSKTWRDDISNSGFWEYKVRMMTGQSFENNSQLSGRSWYNRQMQSGQLCHMLPNQDEKGDNSTSLEYELTSLDNVYSYRTCGHCHYYVTPDGTLYYEEREGSLYQVPEYGFYYGWESDFKYHYDMNNARPYRGCGSWCLIHKKRTHGLGNLLVGTKGAQLTKVEQISNIQDIIPTCIGDFILTFESKLYTIGAMSQPDKLICETDNVKSICGCDILFCYLTWDHKLWLYLDNQFVLQADNVISAEVLRCDCEEDGHDLGGISAKLYYLTENGQLFCRYRERTDEIKTRNYSVTKILPSYQTLTLLARDKQNPYGLWICKMKDGQFLDRVWFGYTIKTLDNISMINDNDKICLVTSNGCVIFDNFNVTNIFYQSGIYFTILPTRI